MSFRIKIVQERFGITSAVLRSLSHGPSGGFVSWLGACSGDRYKARLAFAMLCATLRNGFVHRVNGDSSMDDVETELHSAS